MPAPLANRFLHFEVGPDLDSFRGWAYSEGIHEHILAFLSFRPELLHAVDKNSSAWPSPRSWAMADRLLKVGLSPSAAVGEPAAAELDAFIKVYKSIPNLRKIISGKSKTKFSSEPSTQFATTVGLGIHAKTGEEIGHAFQWLHDQAGPEWCQLFIANAVDAAQAEGRVGELAVLVQELPVAQKFLQEFQDFALWERAA